MRSCAGKIIIFARAPIPGQTKTRLIPALGEAGAARLHAKMIHQTLEKVTVLENVDVELWCAPDTNHHFFLSCADSFGVTLRKQLGADLGERMNSTFTTVLKDLPWAILIGTDCPELTINDLKQAITILRGDVDAVLGPATDGGYVLIGLSRPAQTLFINMPWGSSRVAELTRERLRGIKMHWRELPARNDIDRPEDLVHLNVALKDSAERSGDSC